MTNSGTLQKLLLHVCCAPCSPYVVEQLSKEYDVTLYFYNPNIHPEEEYRLRLSELIDWAEAINVQLIEDVYDDNRWFEKTAGLENEPERGARCDVCFDLRLGRTANKAAELGIEIFGTVLTVSPHKDAVAINRIGESVAESQKVEFLLSDWKKKEGFKVTSRMGKELKFYRQDYCGCVFSQKERDLRVEAKSGKS